MKIKQKLSLKNIQNVLSNQEMKKIMAGSGGGISCGSCNSHPGYTCADQNNGFSDHVCMCGAVSNYLYC
ncbi:hypothetical protein LLH06_10835 [Mucilaginibacter daejeonensis]|uniref:hypothetical protein n=1 Tax=Mucilaginibacter daejeonensis TaxID=398049 RepID=UPI001D171E26|nr:hypothetical protein [Mucilaginibacter daejeonensis]UEG51469.1 hypothetical protein LLH06_10835 [Mucilaginibacter daejeonensis]